MLQWAHQNQYSIAWIAEQIGYAPEDLSRALHRDLITQELSDALMQRFGLRVSPSVAPCDQRDNCHECC
ncbi:MAG: hypothetical protein ETSY2_55100 [Candidatus Entotheonella gemina]|uniref:Uncharacterized protein n=1 Tax=Candidatus Entotheonella gemina TaxID=1429439 RepID=W4L3R2_9BACT|nr:MAG: hypothetical protein ETSY2_55100 [Candidatus Entotheonella gemina]